MGPLGISHAYGGVLSGLSITYSLHRLDAKGEPVAKRDGKHGSSSSAQRWLEIEKVVAVYNDKSRLLTEERRTLTGDYGVYA